MSGPARRRNHGTEPMKTFHLPDLGEGLQEAEIVNWHVGPGDQVVADQPLVSVETDKAVVEIPRRAPAASASCSAPWATSSRSGRRWSRSPDAAATDTGTVVGEISSLGAARRGGDRRRRAGAAVGVKATPAVRALARRKGVDLALVSRRGPRA